MSIERFIGTIQLRCDECGDPHTNTYDSEEFSRMIDDAKYDGWRVRSSSDGWEHYCSDCAFAEDFKD